MIAEANERYADLANVKFEVGYGEAINATQHYDLVTTFDCMHDMTDPEGTMRAVHGCVKADGTSRFARMRRGTSSWSSRPPPDVPARR